MGLSKELQMGKAGEHLVCCDLILQGYSAFLADQGLPFDIVVGKDGMLQKIQVRSTTKLTCWHKPQHAFDNIYRFGTRRGRIGKYRVREAEVDWFAFVALDIREVAYVPISQMIARTGKVKQTMDFKTRRIKYKGRVYSNGTVRYPEWGKYFEDFKKFKFQEKEV